LALIVFSAFYSTATGVAKPVAAVQPPTTSTMSSVTSASNSVIQVVYKILAIF